MIGLDTNVLVRYLMKDDPAQSPIAVEVISNLSRDEPGYVTSIVLAELSWVLTRAYKEPRNRIADGLEALLRSNDLVIENRAASFRALALYRAGRSVDFADALIAMTASLAGALETVSFDRKAAAEAGMRLLERSVGVT
ncbi:MAG: PIN domain-containing protein [Alphaproteobacteria bacterium]